MATHITDLKNSVDGGLSLAPAVRTTSANGTAVDLLTTDGGGFAVIQTGVITDGSHNVKLQEGDKSDGSDAADITGATQAIASTDGSKEFLVNFRRSKRYVRAVTTVGGSPSTGGIVGVSVYAMRKAG